MNVRVVRFTDVSTERLDALKARIDANDGPPEGIKSTGIQILLDRDQGTAVVLQFFDNDGDLRESEAVLEAMDASETPGTRASIDRCEVAIEMKA